jgi:N-methylhydantoinase A
VVLGRFGGGGLLSGAMKLDQARAEQALDDLAQKMSLASGKKVTRIEAALGVIRVANANMERALRLVSVERGQDPRDYTLVSFGGAGGLHAVALAEALRLPRILIPAYPGAFSALGVLLADVSKDHFRTVMLTLESQANSAALQRQLTRHFAQLQQTAQRELRAEGFARAQIRCQKSLTVRYRGQSFELEVAFEGQLRESITLFHQRHHERYGHSDPAAPLEIVSVRLRGIGFTPKTELPPQPKQSRAPHPSAEARVQLARNCQVSRHRGLVLN